MLSDRIKKFGLQSNTEPGSDSKTEQPDGVAVTDGTADEGSAANKGGTAQDKTASTKAAPSASGNNAAQQTAATAAEDATEQAKQALREAFERADAERSDAAEQYVAQKLEGAIHRPASRVQPSRGKNDDDRTDADNGDEYSGDEDGDDSDIPLLLRYSASLESLRGSTSGSGRTARVDSDSDGEADDDVSDSESDESYQNEAEADIDGEAYSGDNAADIESDSDSSGINTPEQSRSDTGDSGELSGVLAALGISPESVETDYGEDGDDSSDGANDRDTSSDSENGSDDPDGTRSPKPSGVFTFGGAFSGGIFGGAAAGTSDSDTSDTEEDIRAEKQKRDKKPLLKTKASTYAPLLAAVIQLLLIISSRISLSSLRERGNIYLSVVVIQLLIYVLPGIFYFKLRREGSIDRLGLKPTPPDRIYIAVLAALLLFLISTGFKLAYLGLGIYESRFAQYAAYINISTFSDPGDILYMVITFVLIPAVSEELIYRSIIFGEYMRDGYGTFIAAAASTLLYALLHTGLQSLPLYLIIGAVLCVVVRITGSVLMSMVTSIVFGLCDVFTENYVTALAHSDYTALVIFTVISLFLLVAVLFFAEAERLYFVLGTSGEKPPVRSMRDGGTRELLRSALLSPTVLICAAIYAIGIVVSFI